MAQVIVQLPMESPILIGNDLYLVPCILNPQNQFVPMLYPEPTTSKQPWTPIEDDLLLQLIDNPNKPKQKWAFISRKINDQLHSGNLIRKPRQCKQRWANHLDPEILKDEWNMEEDIKLLEEQFRVGNKWSSI